MMILQILMIGTMEDIALERINMRGKLKEPGMFAEQREESIVDRDFHIEPGGKSHHVNQDATNPSPVIMKPQNIPEPYPLYILTNQALLLVLD